MSTLRQKHDVELVEGAVAHQVVLGKDDVAPERRVEDRAVVHRGVEAGKGAPAAAADVVGGVLAHPAQRHLARGRLLQHRFVHVGGVDLAPVVEPLLLQHDGEGVGLLAGRAPGVPDADLGVGAEQRHHALAERLVERGVAEHRGDVDGEREHEALQAPGVVQHLLLQAGDGGEAFLADHVPDPAPQRRHRVVAEVVSVLAVDPLQQQADLDVLHRRRQGSGGRLGLAHPSDTAIP